MTKAKLNNKTKGNICCMGCYKLGIEIGVADALKEVEAIIDKSKHTMFSNLINRDDLKQKIQELKEKT